MLVLVDKEVLGQLLEHAWSLTDYGEGITFLLPDSPMVTLAVQARLSLPGPMYPGTAPPAPPMVNDSLANLAAPTFRHANDARLRCAEDGKVVYTSMSNAEHAAGRIAERQPMRAYLGECGHYHVSRVKHHLR